MNAQKNTPSHEAITERARRIWQSGGQVEGQDLENWLRAERELLDGAPEKSTSDAPAPEADSVSGVYAGSPQIEADTTRGGQSIPGRRQRR
jgi:hypothetical protein